MSQWNYVPNIPQIELECGPRTITNIYDILDQIKDGVTLKIALKNISNYNVDKTLYASESRRWAQLFLSNKRYPPYQVQQFQADPDEEQIQSKTRKTNKSKKKKKPIVKKEKEKGNVNIKIREQKITVNPPLISYVVTHEHHIKFGTVYYINKLHTSDEVIFTIAASTVHMLHKSDRQQINQYNASNQFKNYTMQSITYRQSLGKQRGILTTRHFHLC